MDEIANSRFSNLVTVELVDETKTHTIAAAKYGAALTSPRIQVSFGLRLGSTPKA